MEENGAKLLEQWREKSTDKTIPNWCIQVYKQNAQGESIPTNNDQFRLLSRLSNYLSAKN
jgi:hypothetical protein